MPSYEPSAGLLAEAALQPVKAGGLVRLPVTPATVRTATLGGVRRPYDVIPSLGNKHAVRLQCEAHHASAVSVTLSYRPGLAEEVTPSAPLRGGDIPVPTPQPPRHHAAVITFGVGGAQHVLEVDVTEGTVATLPSQVAEVSLVHYGTTALDPLPPVALQSQASAAYGSAGSMRAVKTQRVLMPLGFFFGLDDVDDIFSSLRDDSGVGDAQNAEQVEAALLGALAANHDGQTLQGAYRNALDRIEVALPLQTPRNDGEGEGA